MATGTTGEMAQANPPPAQPRMVIDQSGSGDFRTIGEAIRASVRNLTVQAVGSGDTSGAVWVQRGRVVIEGCDLTSAIGAVVHITGKDSAPVIRDCEIRDGQGPGVYVFEQGQGWTCTQGVDSRQRTRQHWAGKETPWPFDAVFPFRHPHVGENWLPATCQAALMPAPSICPRRSSGRTSHRLPEVPAPGGPADTVHERSRDPCCPETGHQHWHLA